jgi:hypothetical protein
LGFNFLGELILSTIAFRTYSTLVPSLAEIKSISLSMKSNYSYNYLIVPGTSAAYNSILLITGII